MFHTDYSKYSNPVKSCAEKKQISDMFELVLSLLFAACTLVNLFAAFKAATVVSTTLFILLFLLCLAYTVMYAVVWWENRWIKKYFQRINIVEDEV